MTPFTDGRSGGGCVRSCGNGDLGGRGETGVRLLWPPPGPARFSFDAGWDRAWCRGAWGSARGLVASDEEPEGGTDSTPSGLPSPPVRAAPWNRVRRRGLSGGSGGGCSGGTSFLLAPDWDASARSTALISEVQETSVGSDMADFSTSLLRWAGTVPLHGWCSFEEDPSEGGREDSPGDLASFGEGAKSGDGR